MFKKGDKVRVIKGIITQDNPKDPTIGKVGTIVDVFNKSSVFVDFGLEFKLVSDDDPTVASLKAMGIPTRTNNGKALLFNPIETATGAMCLTETLELIESGRPAKETGTPDLTEKQNLNHQNATGLKYKVGDHVRPKPCFLSVNPTTGEDLKCMVKMYREICEVVEATDDHCYRVKLPGYDESTRYWWDEDGLDPVTYDPAVLNNAI